jgi:hypothetical protein
MTKNEQAEMIRAGYYVTMGRPDMAARTLSIIHRSARSAKTQAAVLARVAELGLAAHVTMFNGCLAHVDDVPAVRS